MGGFNEKELQFLKISMNGDGGEDGYEQGLIDLINFVKSEEEKAEMFVVQRMVYKWKLARKLK